MTRQSYIFWVGVVLLLFSSTLEAWEIALTRVGTETPVLSPTVFLLDPDDWTRKDLAVFSSRGARPIAWLNLSQAEMGRTFILGLDSKLPILPKKQKVKSKKTRWKYKRKKKQYKRNSPYGINYFHLEQVRNYKAYSIYKYK